MSTSERLTVEFCKLHVSRQYYLRTDGELLHGRQQANLSQVIIKS